MCTQDDPPLAELLGPGRQVARTRIAAKYLMHHGFILVLLACVSVCVCACVNVCVSTFCLATTSVKKRK